MVLFKGIFFHSISSFLSDGGGKRPTIQIVSCCFHFSKPKEEKKIVLEKIQKTEYRLRMYVRYPEGYMFIQAIFHFFQVNIDKKNNENCSTHNQMDVVKFLENDNRQLSAMPHYCLHTMQKAIHNDFHSIRHSTQNKFEEIHLLSHPFKRST